MADTPTSQTATLSRLAALAHCAAEARRVERRALDERAEAIVAAIRAGAHLDEIGEAAGITKAAASAIARRTLGARTGSGGPYRRRRGAGAALERVSEAAQRARQKSGDAHEAILMRDHGVVAAADSGLAVPAMAEAMSMNRGAVYELIRRHQK